MNRDKVYREAIRKGAGWIRAHQAGDGSHVGASDVLAYYTCPLALQAAGHTLDALRCLDFVKKSFVRPDGSLTIPESLEKTAAYAPSWLARAAHQWGRVDISHGLMKSILSFQDPQTGGFFGSCAERDAGRGTMDFDTSSVAIMACIWTGHLEEAARGGEYLLQLDQLQPDRDRRYYYVLTSDGKLQTDPGADDSRTVYMEKGQPLQFYYKTGLYTALMTYLHRVNPRQEYLEAALRCADFALNCADDVFSTILAHKFCWGAAELYQQTGAERLREASLEIADYLARKQRPDGRWHYVELVPKFDDQPVELQFDLCAQLTTWIAKALEVH
jgi:hypothetical protein